MTYCCVNCFRDTHIIDTIRQTKIIGNCDFCSSRNVPVIDISKPNPVSEMILRLIQAYSVSDHENAKPLKESLRDDWDIFNGGCEIIQALIKALCTIEINENDDIFKRNVIIPQMYDQDFQVAFGVVSGLSWKEFSEYIKYTNRFHNEFFNKDAFSSFLSLIKREYGIDTVFYRARICNNKIGYTEEQMYGPPKGCRQAGRINPEEIGVIYLSSDKDTILCETRANVYDYISIGEFKLKRQIKIVDLSSISKISPFLYDEIIIESFAINRNVFLEMSKEIAKPMRRNDSPFEYLPTQFISEFIKSQGYDGVAYESTIKKDGYNFALFDESLVECTNVETVEITGINYLTN